MRWTRALVSVTASLASFSAGATRPDDALAAGERGAIPPHHVETTGYAAWGRCFYVWEEDSRQAREWAAELSSQSGPEGGAGGRDEPGGSETPAR